MKSFSCHHSNNAFTLAYEYATPKLNEIKLFESRHNSRFHLIPFNFLSKPPLFCVIHSVYVYEFMQMNPIIFGYIYIYICYSIQITNIRNTCAIIIKYEFIFIRKTLMFQSIGTQYITKHLWQTAYRICS